MENYKDDTTLTDENIQDIQYAINQILKDNQIFKSGTTGGYKKEKKRHSKKQKTKQRGGYFYSINKKRKSIKSIKKI